MVRPNLGCPGQCSGSGRSAPGVVRVPGARAAAVFAAVRGEGEYRPHLSSRGQANRIGSSWIMNEKLRGVVPDPGWFGSGG